jgi:hypothetical protein
MGVEPFLTGAAVSAVLAQRLARKLCTHCCEMYTPSTDELIKARVSPEVAARRTACVFYRKKRLPALQPDRLQGPDRHLPAAVDERGRSRASPLRRRRREEIERAAIARACARSGTTASPRSPPASRRSKSSPASHLSAVRHSAGTDEPCAPTVAADRVTLLSVPARE